MNTHPDGKYRVGNLTLSPYVPWMPVAERHRQRYEKAMESLPIVRAWCEQRGVQFWVTTNNTGHPHATSFKFKVLLRQDAAVAVWVPGVGRAIARASSKAMSHNRRRKWRRRNGRFSRPGTRYAHLHDWHQLLLFLERWLESIPAASR
jgi:hypothetical protein